MKVVISTHAVYEFSGESLFSKVTRWVFNRGDKIFSLLRHSKDELVKLGVEESKVEPYTYWVDQERFKTTDKKIKKEELHWDINLFHVLFVGRLIEKKGIRELLTAANKIDDSTKIHIIGTGDLDAEVEQAAKENKRIINHGRVDNNKLEQYMQAADVLIVPSTHEEGAGRVIMEALSCGTPVIGSNRGGIPEILNESVGSLINVSPEAITENINGLRTRIQNNEISSEKCREYALKHFSRANAEKIIKAYNI